MMNNFSNCYRLKWSEFDNPNGWIEPTTFCNISCPGCYRGLDRPEHKPEHLDINELKNQIDWFISERNVHTISISGGEPLMYPKIFELISYAVESRLRVMLYTNGILLNRETALKLSETGLTQILIHIDRFQSRPDLADGKSITELRTDFVEMFRTIPKTRLGFIQPVSPSCSDEVNGVMQLLANNIDIINLMVFTLYRNVCWNEKSSSAVNTNITISQLVESIKQNHEFVPAACIISENGKNEPTWLFAQRIGVPGKIFGFISPSFYGFAHERFRKKFKKYLFISSSNSLSLIKLTRFFPWISVTRILARAFAYFANTGKWQKGKVYFQTFLIIRGPEKRNGKWDLCRGCPDRIIYKKKLIPSCILEDLKNQDLSKFENAKSEK